MSTRIKLRYDDYTTWDTSNPTLLPGEFAVAKKADGSIDVRVGSGAAGTNNLTNWKDAPQISGATPLENFDFTNLALGDIIYWNGTEWNNASLSERILGGSNIQVVEDSNGKITINHFTATYSPTASLSESNALIEVRNRYNNTSYNVVTNPGGLGLTIDFTVTNGGNVPVANGSVTAAASENFSESGEINTFIGFGAKSFNFSSLEISDSFGASIGSGGFSINNDSQRSDMITVTMVPATATGSGAPFSGQPVSTNLHFNYGWRRFFVWSQTDYTNPTSIQADYADTPSSFVIQSDSITSNPNSESTFTVTAPSGTGNWYLYYMHSSNGTGSNDTFAWNPVFKALNGDIEPFTEITVGATSGIAFDTYAYNTNFRPAKQYRVWKFANPVSPLSIVTFKVS